MTEKLNQTNIMIGYNETSGQVNLDLAQTGHVLVIGKNERDEVGTTVKLVQSMLEDADTKGVGLTVLSRHLGTWLDETMSPYMLVAPSDDVKKATETLGLISLEMDIRYQRMNAIGAKTLKEYNKYVDSHDTPLPHLNYIVNVIENINDFAGYEPMEKVVDNLVAKGRGAGVLVLISTQTARRDAIWNLKDTIPTKLVYQVANEIESELAIGEPSALYLNADEFYLNDADGLMKLKTVG